MPFVADLHVHSRYSRACSRDCDLEHLAWWAARKGITLVGTGDLCHPAWAEEIRTKLVPADPGAGLPGPAGDAAGLRRGRLPGAGARLDAVVRRARLEVRLRQRRGLLRRPGRPHLRD